MTLILPPDRANAFFCRESTSFLGPALLEFPLMVKNATKQEYAIAIELQESTLSLETVHYRMESGLFAGHPTRVIAPSSHTLPEATQSWFRLRRDIQHYGLPQLIDADVDPSTQDSIVESWQARRSLDDYLDEKAAELSELSAVYLTLQAAMVLDKLLQVEAAIPVLKSSEFMIDDADDGLPRLVYLGWRPPEFVPEGSWEPDALQFLARLLYRCLTGVQPPSDQVSAMSPDLEEADLGFDDLFLTWVTEEKDLGALGEAAMSALRPSETGCRISTFISDVYPHLKRATNLAIEDAVQRLATDRELLAEVDQHRLSLKEHRTRQRYLSGWLLDNQPRLDTDSTSVEARSEYLTTVKSFSGRLRHTLSQTLKSQSVASTQMPPEHLPLVVDMETDGLVVDDIAEDKIAPLSFQALADNLDAPSTDFMAIVPEVESHHAEGPTPEVSALVESATPSAAAESKGTNRTLLFILLIVFLATIIGVVVAWGLLSYQGNQTNQNETPVRIEGEDP